MSLDEFTEAWKAGKFDGDHAFSWRRCCLSIGQIDHRKDLR